MQGRYREIMGSIDPQDAADLVRVRVRTRVRVRVRVQVGVKVRVRVGVMIGCC